MNTGYNSRATADAPPRVEQYDEFVRHLHASMVYHLRMAERSANAYRRRRGMLKARHVDPAAYLVAKRDDYTIQDAISTLSFHQNMASMYSAVLGGQAAAEALVAPDHTGHLR
jgi:hypothetical protein